MRNIMDDRAFVRDFPTNSNVGMNIPQIHKDAAIQAATGAMTGAMGAAVGCSTTGPAYGACVAQGAALGALGGAATVYGSDILKKL